MKKNKEVMKAYLAKDTEFDGKLTFKGAVRIDGRFKGEIVSSDGTLVVGDDGVVESDIHVTNIVVCGEVRGNIAAGDRIEIQANAKVFGNIQGQSISINEGAVFEGNCQMKDSAKVELISEKSQVKKES